MQPPPPHQLLPPLCQPLETAPTDWNPEDVRVSLNIALDGCIVPTADCSARVDYSALVVLDDFIDEPTRVALLAALTAPDWPVTAPSPPAERWTRTTSDADGCDATWGMNADALAELSTSQLPAKLEVQSRLAKLYPDVIWGHLPSESIQVPQQRGHLQQKPSLPLQRQGHQEQHQQQQEDHQQQEQQQEEQQQEEQQQQQQQSQEQPPRAGDCCALLANAAVAGDAYSWHVDADPAAFPVPSPWTHQYGLYANREPGRPRLVSLLLYLDAAWPLDCHGETLFLDACSGTGVLVRPVPRRAVLLDQDIAHRLVPPSTAAGRPRYSLVWKLVMWQRGGGAGPPPALWRPEWGLPTYFGSAGRVREAARRAAAAAAAAAAVEKGAEGKARSSEEQPQGDGCSSTQGMHRKRPAAA